MVDSTMGETCAKCGRQGSAYFSRNKGKGGQIYFGRYMRHVGKTGRKGEALQTTCYLGPATQEQYDARPTKRRIVESTETPSAKLAGSAGPTVKQAIEDLENLLTSHAGVVTWGDKTYPKGKPTVIQVLQDYLAMKGEA